jgi:hypothetical protein
LRKGRAMLLRCERPAAKGGASKVLELKPQRRRAGRNYQLLLKVKSETAVRLAALADAEGVCLGEFLEHMLEVYEANRGKTDDRPGT